jgi:hypothetical protein
MIANTFPRTQGTLSRDTYLTLLLLALVQQAGGELHLSATSLESIDNGGRLLVDWDSAAQQLVIRAGSPSLVVAEVRGTGWTQPSASTQSSQNAPPASSHRVMTEEEIIQRIQQRVQADRMREWRAQGAATVAGMPPPEETPQ